MPTKKRICDYESFVSLAQASSISVERLCEDYVKVSQASRTYKGDAGLLQQCFAINSEAQEENRLKRTVINFLERNTSVQVNNGVRPASIDSTKIRADHLLECYSSVTESYCRAYLAPDSNVCEIGFSSAIFQFDMDNKYVKSIRAGEKASCVSW